MIAKIKNGETIYDAFVFAASFKGRESKVVVLDEAAEKLIIVDYWDYMDRNVLFTDMNCDGYSYNTDIYKSYWHDNNIIKTIEKEKYSEEMLNEAKKLQKSIRKDKWIKINSKDDLEALMFSTGTFHDAYIMKIKETDECLEILINTTWNSYIHLKCYGVINNELNEYINFSYCYYEYQKDKIKLLFDSFELNDDIILETKEMEFKVYHEFKYNFTDFNIYDNKITFYNKKEISKIINTNDLVSNSVFDIETVGTINYPFGIGLHLFYEDYVLSIVSKRNEDEEDLNSLYANEIIKYFNQNGLNLYLESEIVYPEWQFDYGNVIYEEVYSKTRNFLYYSKFAMAPMLINIAFWLIIKLSNPEMKWIAFYIFGVGISLFVCLIFLIVYFKEYHFTNPTITLFELGIIQKGCNNPFLISYKDIKNIVKGKKIIIETTNNKFKIIKSKNNDYIYNLIKEKVDKLKEV